MIGFYWAGGLLAVFLFVYLLHALWHAEDL